MLRNLSQFLEKIFEKSYKKCLTKSKFYAKMNLELRKREVNDMKFKDLEKFVNETIKFDEFKGKKERVEIRVIEKFADFKANSFKELYKGFSEEYYGEINKDTEIRYEDGEMMITIKYQERNWNCEEHKFEYTEKAYDWCVYVDIIETDEFRTIEFNRRSI